MPHVIVKDRRLAIADRHLVTDADGAPCCCDSGVQYIRAVDCCSNVAGWFPLTAFQCVAAVGVVVLFSLRCWRVSGPTLTEAEIRAQYPQERIYTPSAQSLVCLPGCNHASCPSCAGCCYTAADQQCGGNDPRRCDCVRGPCACGRRWVANFSYTHHYEDWGRGGCAAGFCFSQDNTVIGAVEWFYDEPAPGVCELKMVAVTGTVHVKLTPGQSPCDLPPYDITLQLADLYSWPDYPFPFIGCGDSPFTVLAWLQSIVRNALPGGYQLVCLSSNTCSDTLCACQYDDPCGPFKAGFHESRTGNSSCLGGGINRSAESLCPTSCALSERCTEQVQFNVNVLSPCQPDKDIDTLPGGTFLGLPGTGGLL